MWNLRYHFASNMPEYVLLSITITQSQTLWKPNKSSLTHLLTPQFKNIKIQSQLSLQVKHHSISLILQQIINIQHQLTIILFTKYPFEYYYDLFLILMCSLAGGCCMTVFNPLDSASHINTYTLT